MEQKKMTNAGCGGKLAMRCRALGLIALGMVVAVCLCSCDPDSFFQPYWPPEETDTGDNPNPESVSGDVTGSNGIVESDADVTTDVTTDDSPGENTESQPGDVTQPDSEHETEPGTQPGTQSGTQPDEEPSETDPQDPEVELPKVEFD